MAELIDKGALIDFIEKKFDMKCDTEHGQGYVDAMHDMKDVIIALMPTVTEAEIRAKAIDEFAEKMEAKCNVGGVFVGCEVRRMIEKLAEQLKE